MTIQLKDGSQTLEFSNEELDNSNFIDITLYDEEAKDNDNPLGFVSECTAPLGELKHGVDAFWRMSDRESLIEE